MASGAYLGEAFIFRVPGGGAKWFARALCAEGIDARNLGSDEDHNVRVFWNWRFLFESKDATAIKAQLPATTCYLEQAVDIPLSSTLSAADCDQLVTAVRRVAAAMEHGAGPAGPPDQPGAAGPAVLVDLAHGPAGLDVVAAAVRLEDGGAGALGLLAPIVAACSGGPSLANPPAAHPTQPPGTPAPVALPDPQPIVFPRGDGPHHRLTEWWYDTGHLQDTTTGAWYGFEYVIFRAERGAFPVAWASHLAITDESGDRFLYAQRSEIGPQVDRSPTVDGSPTGFAFDLTGADPTRPETYANPVWSMAGSDGHAMLSATLSTTEAAAAGSSGGMGLELTLDATKPPVLHDGDGWIDFGPAGGSYYYSRTRMAASGTLTIDGERHAVVGEAWFDHQWGDFIAVGAGGWDWFAVDLDDGSVVTLSLIRASDGSYPLVYGTYVAPDGTVWVTDSLNFRVEHFDPDGKFLNAFGRPGSGAGDFDKAKGIAVDREGRVYVVEGLNDRVQVYDPEGRLQFIFGGTGSASGEFFLLFSQGTLVDLRFVSGDPSIESARIALKNAIAAKIHNSLPDDRAVNIVRRAIVVCSSLGATCDLVLLTPDTVRSVN